MPRNKAISHVKVLAAARAEFMEYGFENAFMRRIGERCGMTAAALYRHCTNKEELFSELVEPSIEKIDVWLDAHLARHFAELRTDSVTPFSDTQLDMMRELIYPNMEEYCLLLTKAQGTRYENFLHDLVDKQQYVLQTYLTKLREKGFAVRDISPNELHSLLSAYITALFEPVVHHYTPEEAYRCLDTLEVFFLPGWKILMGC